jgi:hypothetical protein
MVAIGGGARTFSALGATVLTSQEVIITQSYPTPVGASPRTGWHAQAQQITGGSSGWSIEATVICA